MSEGIYASLAPVYDSFNGELDYSAWADFIEKSIKENLGCRAEYILDLACGTGKMTIELAKRGYDMIGVDISSEMLTVARERAEDAGTDGILWLCQDMTEFELYGTVEATVCCLDAINHLLTEKEVSRCFSLVHNYLVPDGIFIFDINSEYKFETVYGQNDYVFEDEGSLCVWQNDYCDGFCDFYISLFEKNTDGSYRRTDSEQSEKMYTAEQIKRLLKENSLELIAVYGDDFGEPTATSERLHFVARAKK